MTGVSGNGLLEEMAALRRELAVLREAALRRRRVSLHADPGGASGTAGVIRFLGEPVNLVARVADGRGAALAGVPVTLVAPWGRLSGGDGYSLQAGPAVTLRTGVDGAVRASLRAPLPEELWDVQQAALETALAALDRRAATPRDVADGLRAMVREYRWDAGLQLRNAIDIYFREFGQGVLDTVNYRDHMAQWSYCDAVIMAYAPEDDSEAPAHAVAVLTVRFKDWLGPWLETYLSMAGGEGRLGEELGREAQPGRDPGAIVEGVYARARDYVMKERGVAGAKVAGRVAEAKVREFLTRGATALPVATRTALFPALETATRVLSSAGVETLGAVAAARTDLRREVDAKLGTVDTVGLADRVGALEVQVAGKIGQAELEAGLGSRVEASALERALAGKADSSALNAALLQKANAADVASALALKVDATAFSSAMSTKVDASEFTAFRQQTQTTLAAKVDSSTFEARMASKADAAALNALRDHTDAALGNKVDVATFNELSTSVNMRLSGLQEATTGLASSLTALSGDFARYKAGTDGSIQALNESATAVSARMDGLQGAVKALDTSVTGLGNSVLALRVDVGRTRGAGPIR